MRLGIYKCYLACKGYFRFCLPHIQTYLSNIQEHTHAYSQPCVSINIQNPAYSYYKVNSQKVHLGRLIQFWMRLSLKDAMLYGVFNIIFQTYPDIFKIYSAIFILAKAY